MLAGEPGIGKTRIAQELAAHASNLGAQTFWGWSYEHEGAPPYWPWVQPIRSYVQRTDAELLGAQMGSGAADICEIIPELRDKLPGLEAPAPLEPEQARFRLFDSIATFLKNLAHARSLLLILDDLQWADQPSLLLLEFLARQVPDSKIMLVGTYRDVEVTRTHPLSNTLAQLAHGESYHRELLGGLESDDVGHLIRDISGAEPSQQLVQAIYGHTEGNPFFMTEVIRLLGERKQASGEPETDGPGGLEIPQSVLDVIGQRLNRLSADCVGVLTTAAVIGRQFDFRLLGILSEEFSESQLLDFVDEALDAYLIQEVPGQGDDYQFSHALVQQTLGERVSASRRVRLHAKIGETLETLYGDQPENHASELARHFAEAATVTGKDKLVHYSLLAGERALATFAYEDALSHFQRALVARSSPVSEGSGEGLNDETAEILFGLAQAQAATLQRSQLQEARSNLNRVLDYYLETGDVDRAVKVAVFPVPPIGGSGDTIRNLDRILSLVPPESIEAGVLYARYGFVVGVEEGDYQRAQDAFGRALVIASQEKDSDLEALTLDDAARVDSYNHWWESSLEKSIRAVGLAQRAGNTRLELSARYRAAWALLTLGDAEGAMEQSKLVLEIAETVRDRYWLVNTLWLNELLSRLYGDWQASAEFSDRGLAIWPRDPRLLGSRTLLEYESGDFGKGEEYLERLIKAMALTQPGSSLEYVNVACIVPIIARITGHTDRLEQAARAGEAVLASPEATEGLVRDVIAGLGLIAVIRDEPEEAEKHYPILSAEEGRILFASLSCDRLLGLLSCTLSRYDDAVPHFEDSLSFCRKASYRPELAWTCHDYAGNLLQRDAVGDRAKAISLLDESLAISSELGMRPLTERVVALQEQAEAQTVKTPAYPDGLTKREVEVLRLVASGKTDREIAEELIISVRTVTTHVGNILNKVGAANRTEAATYATRSGLA